MRVSFITSVLIHLLFAVIVGIYPTLQNKEIVKETNKYVVDLFKYQPDDTDLKVDNRPDIKEIDMSDQIIESPVKQAIPVPTETTVTKEGTEKKDVAGEKKKLLTMKDLMPSYKQLLSSSKITSPERMKDEGVSLNTKDLKYLSYFSKVKEKIEMVWTYPEAAKAAGLQGELTLVFLLKKDGSLVYAKVIKSSGIALLDDEAVKSVKKAMPYFPLPKNLGKRLKIVANFRYSLGNFSIR